MKKTVTILLSLLALILAAFSVFIVVKEDNTAPVIAVKDQSFVYMGDSDSSVLLSAVTATDDKDGDVSASLKIEKIAVTPDGASVKVTYAAKDSKNNIKKAIATFGYVPAQNEGIGEQTQKRYNILIINNLGVENLASSYAKILKDAGHNIVNVGLSTDAPATETVIYVKNAGDGQELLEFFPNAKIINENIATRVNVPAANADTFIVLGHQHSLVPDTKN